MGNRRAEEPRLVVRHRQLLMAFSLSEPDGTKVFVVLRAIPGRFDPPGSLPKLTNITIRQGRPFGAGRLGAPPGGGVAA